MILPVILRFTIFFIPFRFGQLSMATPATRTFPIFDVRPVFHVAFAVGGLLARRENTPVLPVCGVPVPAQLVRGVVGASNDPESLHVTVSTAAPATAAGMT